MIPLHSAARFKTIGWGWIPPSVGSIVFPQVAAACRGVVCLSRMVAVYGGWLSTGSQQLLSQFSPQSLCPQSFLKSLLSTLPHLCQWSTVSGCLFQIFCLVTKTQQSGLSIKRQSRDSPGVGAIVSLRLLPLRGKWSAWAQRLLWSGGWLSTRIPVATLSVLSSSFYTQYLFRYL